MAPEEARDWIRIPMLVLLVGAFLRNLRVRAEFIKKHPPVPYAPPGGESFRFGELPRDLGTDIERADEPEASRITLPERRKGSQTAGSIAGWILMIGGGLLLVQLLIDPADPDMGLGLRLGLPALIMLMGFGLTYVDSAIQVIELTPERATFIGCHGFVFYQRIVVKRDPGLKFAGSTESVLTMHSRAHTSTIELPSYIIMVSGGWSLRKRILLRCTPAQGTWIRDALAYWASSRA